MIKLFKQLFLPHKTNAFRPHAFRHKALSFYCIVFILSQLLLGVTFYAGPVQAESNTKSMTQNIFILSNQQRYQVGLHGLYENKLLSLAAQDKLTDMFSENYWDHKSPDGKTAWDFIERSGYKYSLAGENLGRGFRDSKSLVDAWMASPTHKANILNPRFREIGLAVGTGKINNITTTIIVQLFGEPKTIFANQSQDNQSILGEKKIILNMSLANASVPSKAPYFAAWLLIFGLIILDGVMIRRLKLHTSKIHIFNFRIALVCSSAALTMLTMGFSAIA